MKAITLRKLTRVLRATYVLTAVALTTTVRAATPHFLPPVDIGTLGGSYSAPRSVNSGGVVVGSSSLAGDQSNHAFMWTQTRGMIDLGTLGGTYSEAVAITDSGIVVGNSWLAGDVAYHAFVWTQTSGMIDLGTLGGKTAR